jgi:putative transposase
MPRVARTVLVDTPLHVVQRGINRANCFHDASDYRAYLRFMGESAERFGCSVHAYCLMTNHVHLLLTPKARDSCARLMKQLGQCYVQRMNHRLERTGTLWQGRFHSSLVTSEHYVLACYRYIELNPVRAGLVSNPDDYPWSSYRSNAWSGQDELVERHPVYMALHAEQQSRLAAYRALCKDGLAETDAEEIRKATRNGRVIGARTRGPGRPSKLDEKNRVCP